MSISFRHILSYALGTMMLASMAACHSSEKSNTNTVESPATSTVQPGGAKDGNSIVGKVFPDAKLVTNYGKETSLNQLLSTPYALLVLYRPSDDDYHHSINQLTLDHGIENAIIDKQLSVVVINLEGNLDELHTLASAFPTIWRLTALTDDLEDVPTPLNPTVYLINSDSEVLLQNPDTETLLKAVNTAVQQ